MSDATKHIASRLDERLTISRLILNRLDEPGHDTITELLTALILLEKKIEGLEALQDPFGDAFSRDRVAASAITALAHMDSDRDRGLFAELEVNLASVRENEREALRYRAERATDGGAAADVANLLVATFEARTSLLVHAIANLLGAGDIALVDDRVEDGDLHGERRHVGEVEPDGSA